MSSCKTTKAKNVTWNGTIKTVDWSTDSELEHMFIVKSQMSELESYFGSYIQ